MQNNVAKLFIIVINGLPACDILHLSKLVDFKVFIVSVGMFITSIRKIFNSKEYQDRSIDAILSLV